MLNKDEFVPHGERLKPGETVNIFHCRNGTGNDRLYVTKTRNGKSIIAYCHHCGEKGFHSKENTITDTLEQVDKLLKGQPDQVEVKDIKLPEDCMFDVSEWPTLCASWIYLADINPVEIAENDICYSPSMRRVIIPVLKDNRELVGYQARRVFANDQGPKYVTYRKEGTNLFMNNKCSHPIDRNTCVLVEDKLSAIKCSRFLDSIWLLGTNVSTGLVNYISKYENVIIFLDNDNPKVKDKQLKLHRILSTVVKNKVKVCFADKDPKNYYHADLQRKLTSCLL